MELIDDVDLRLLKVEVTFDSLRAPDSAYHHLINKKIGTEVKLAQEEMTSYQHELEEQRALKELKSQYEAIAKEINAFEPQGVIQAKLLALGS